MLAAKDARKSGEFLSDAALELTGGYRLPGRRLRPERRLVEPIVFELGGEGSGVQIVVPRGYITDGYSMPGALLQAFQPHTARWLQPAILHDWLYDAGLVPRGVADRVLLHAMRAAGVSKPRAFIVYWAVRLGGRGGFGKPEPANLALVRDARTAGVRDAIFAFLKNQEETRHV